MERSKKRPVVFLEYMVCQQCQTREATVHTTLIFGYSAEESKHTDLCQACFEVSDTGSVHPLALAKTGCRYCGAEAYAGRLELPGEPSNKPSGRALCDACHEEYTGQLEKRFLDFGKAECRSVNPENLLEKLKSLIFFALGGELDEHMKQWAAKRGSL